MRSATPSASSIRSFIHVRQRPDESEVRRALPEPRARLRLHARPSEPDRDRESARCTPSSPAWRPRTAASSCRSASWAASIRRWAMRTCSPSCSTIELDLQSAIDLPRLFPLPGTNVVEMEQRLRDLHGAGARSARLRGSAPDLGDRRRAGDLDRLAARDAAWRLGSAQGRVRARLLSVRASERATLHERTTDELRHAALHRRSVAHGPRRPGLDSGAKRNALKRSGFERPFQARQSRLGMAS